LRRDSLGTAPHANQTLLELKRQIQTREPRDVIDAVVRFAGRAMQDNSAKPRNFNPMSIPCLSDEARKAVSASF
jgi:hypothetical protein